MPSPEQRLVIWRLTDGKAGHENQTQGLIQALSQIHTVQSFDIFAPDNRPGLLDLLLKRLNCASSLPDPDLIIGAGHRTHLLLLAAKHARGGRSIVLMRPSLPRALFDLCLIPAHDGVTASDNTLLTHGVLNTIRPHAETSADQGLILIGGPSSHHQWAEQEVINAVRQIVQKNPQQAWQVTDSRRTPASSREKLQGLKLVNLRYTPCTETPAGWVAQQLDRAAQVWVTADSVSMLYEALTSGAATGLIEIPVKQTDRITRGVEELLEHQYLTRYTDWLAGQPLQPPQENLAEADRCAAEISQRWLQ